MGNHGSTQHRPCIAEADVNRLWASHCKTKKRTMYRGYGGRLFPKRDKMWFSKVTLSDESMPRSNAVRFMKSVATEMGIREALTDEMIEELLDEACAYAKGTPSVTRDTAVKHIFYKRDIILLFDVVHAAAMGRAAIDPDLKARIRPRITEPVGNSLVFSHVAPEGVVQNIRRCSPSPTTQLADRLFDVWKADGFFPLSLEEFAEGISSDPPPSSYELEVEWRRTNPEAHTQDIGPQQQPTPKLSCDAFCAVRATAFEKYSKMRSNDRMLFADSLLHAFARTYPHADVADKIASAVTVAWKEQSSGSGGDVSAEVKTLEAGGGAATGGHFPSYSLFCHLFPLFADGPREGVGGTEAGEEEHTASSSAQHADHATPPVSVLMCSESERWKRAAQRRWLQQKQLSGSRVVGGSDGSEHCAEVVPCEGSADPAEALPTDLMLHVLSFLSAYDLSRCCAVSTRWYKLAHADDLWQALFEELFQRKRFVEGTFREGGSAPSVLGWKAQFVLHLNHVVRKIDEELEEQRRMENSVLAMFHPINARTNYAPTASSCAASARSPLDIARAAAVFHRLPLEDALPAEHSHADRPQMGKRHIDEGSSCEKWPGHLPPRSVCRAMLRREEELRLHPQVQLLYRRTSLYSALDVTRWIHLRVALEFGLWDHRVVCAIVSHAQAIQDEELLSIPHYIRHNRTRAARVLSPGDAVPDVPLYTLAGCRTSFHAELSTLAGGDTAKPLVVVAGSYT
eukprot:TRINITY_DN4545_c0_g1_i3.p1 TRINITY_DN4545_c0_g1~~TRINITY_DN4545_c0_g1_i3.p1  ORF type:complete len:740 (-),score=155.92 TRINITY_DN4545_c0_g1_i3:551-2770(-)